MVRTREFDPESALTTAMKVFAARGYSNSSIDDVVKATGVSRYGLYGTFGNKRELFEKALERYTEHMGRAAFLRLLEPDSRLEDIRHTFMDRIDHIAKSGQQSGCLVVYTAMELAPKDKEIEEVLHRLLRRIAKAYEIGLQHAQEAGELRDGLDIKETATFLTGAFFGMTVMARCGFDIAGLTAYANTTVDTIAL